MLRRPQTRVVQSDRASADFLFDRDVQARREANRSAHAPLQHRHVKNSPAQLRMVSYPVTIPVKGKATQVLQSNVRRIRLVIPNRTGAMMFIAFDPSDNSGIPVANNQNYSEASGTISLDAIYVITSIDNVTVRVYEGIAVSEAEGLYA